MTDIIVIVEPAHGVKCERCKRMVPWHVPGLDICGRCRDVGMEDGWLTYDEASATFAKKETGSGS